MSTDIWTVGATSEAAPDRDEYGPLLAVNQELGAELLDQVRAFIARFVAFPSESAAVAVTLWAAHAHLVHVGENSPRLALLSPEPGSGKTRTLEVLELLVPNPMAALNASAPPIFRSIGSDTKPTLLFDEVDAIFGRRGKDDQGEDLRGLLNSGHRSGAFIPRCVGPSFKVERFPTFAACALAGLGDLPDTLMDRSVIIRMRRRAPGENVEPFRRRMHSAAGGALRESLAEWAASVADQVRDAWPTMPAGITDRPADVWEPLLAVADAAGGHWPDIARAACVELAKVSLSREASLGVRLLADLRDIFGESDAMHTEAVLDRLHKLAEAPWDDLHGKPLDARGLARRLRQYEIRSVNVNLGDVIRKGYRREHLWDTWTRYLPPSGESATSAMSATDSDSERETAHRQVADRAAGSATSGSQRYLPDPDSERHPAAGSAGSGRSALPNTGPAGPDCGHPASAVHTITGRCGSCVALKHNAAEARMSSARADDAPELPHRCKNCSQPIRHRGGMCVSCFAEVSRKAKEVIS